MARAEKNDEKSVASHDEDDAALRWDGDDVTPTPTPKPTASAPAAEKPANAPKPGTSSVALVSFGILGGIYLIYTIGWGVGMHHVQTGGGDVLSTISAAVAQGLALGSPALWFLTTLYLTRKRSSLARLLALISGLIVVLPWPFILLGA
jgi:hypothetical protein